MLVTKALSSGWSSGNPQLRTFCAMPSWRQNSMVRTLTSSILAGPSLFSFFSTSMAATPRRPRSAASASPIGPPPTIRTGVRAVVPIAMAGLRRRGHVHRHPSGRRLFAGMHAAAVLAGARLRIVVERGEQRWQVLHDILDLHLDPMHALAAVEAKPFEAVNIGLAPRALDHEANRPRNRTLRRVTRVRPDNEHVAFLDRHVVDLAILSDLKKHVALELIEELLDRIVMKIDALVGSADNHDRHVGFGVEQLLVSDRRFEKLLVLGDPALEVERAKARMLQHVGSFRRSSGYSAATTCGFLARRRPHVSNAALVAAFSDSLSSTSGRRNGPPTWPSSTCQYF